MLLIDAIEIASYWGIKVLEAKNLSDRATHIITDVKENFILKKKEGLEKARNEIELLKHLYHNQISVPLPLVSNEGDCTIIYNNEIYCMYNYLDGNIVRSEDAVQNQIIPRLFGKAIASIHKEMLDVEIAINFEHKNLYNQVYNWAVKEVLKINQDKELKEIYLDLEKDLKEIVEKLPKQLIHRDAHLSNILLKDQHVSGIIDFEIAEVNIRVFDPCYCCTSVLSEIFSIEPLKELWFDFVPELFRGYNKLNPLNELEIQSIPKIMLAIQTIFMAYFVNYPTIFEINKAMFLWIYKNQSKLTYTIIRCSV
ncbi:phosphotransferase enzyme family protein [Bacillus cereus]|uniref:phosphotransferase enzyme family protein n=1 Tax=Bacillus cereus TaxID=1396 RepID=UPI0038151D6E